MTQNKKVALIFVTTLVVCFAAISARAQAPTGQIIIKANSGKVAETKPIKARFEVLHMMINAIQVRSLVDEREIHTFIYSDQIRDRMQALFNNGGFQYGDKVVIHFAPGSDVALNIKGKPSKPI
jgi:hypothetical protein